MAESGGPAVFAAENWKTVSSKAAFATFADEMALYPAGCDGVRVDVLAMHN